MVFKEIILSVSEKVYKIYIVRVKIAVSLLPMGISLVNPGDIIYNKEEI